MSIAKHQSAKYLKDEWLTPPNIIDQLGPFDLDPCAPESPPWPTARAHFSIFDNGLNREWFGRVWLNPPYNNKTEFWLNRLADHGNGIALIFARTETDIFFNQVWNKAKALLFLRGRLYFHHVDGTRARSNSGAPSVLIAYDENNAEKLKNSNIPGKYLVIN